MLLLLAMPALAYWIRIALLHTHVAYSGLPYMPLRGLPVILE